MKITIRKALLDDLQTLNAIEQSLIDAERPMDPSLRQHEKIKYYDIGELISGSNSKVFVAEVDTIIVGTGYGLIKESSNKYNHQYFGYVGFIFVKEAYRGHGISSMVIEAIFNWFRSRDIIETRLQVYNDNPHAIKAYEKIGFEKRLIEMIHNLD